MRRKKTIDHYAEEKRQVFRFYLKEELVKKNAGQRDEESS